MEKILEEIINYMEIKKVPYGEVRFVEINTENIKISNSKIENISKNFSSGIAIKVFKNTWGFVSTNVISLKEIFKKVDEAIKKAELFNYPDKEKFLKYLLSYKTQKGEYKTPIIKNPFKIDTKEKINLLLEIEEILRKSNKIKQTFLHLSFTNKKIIFLSTKGDYIKQEFYWSNAGYSAIGIEKNERQIRSFPEVTQQKGWELIEELPLKEEAERIREEVLILLKSKPCPYLEKAKCIIGSNQMALHIHETVGHPIEFDRVLKWEESYAGTSFLKPEDINSFVYGAPIVNIIADATYPFGNGTFKWDDEGTPAQRFYIVKNGIFKNFLTSKDSAFFLNQLSNGASRASSWNRLPIVRMTNINLLPGNASFEELLQKVENGFYLEGIKSWSIDQKRINFHFGVEICREIKNGKLGTYFKNAFYTGNTLDFWRNVKEIGDWTTLKLWGFPNCGKGDPNQTMFVGHATPPVLVENLKIGTTH